MVLFELEINMSWVDQEFADRFCITLDGYKKVSHNPFKINARCPVCGDSLRNRSKARFWIYPHKHIDTLCVKCFNCDYSSFFNKFLKEHNETMYREYLIEKRKESIFELPVKTEKQQPKQKATKATSSIDMSLCKRLDQLSENHPIVKYVSDRQIPKDKWHLLYFTTEWKKFVNTIKKTYTDPEKEPRLVIPIFDGDDIVAVQGRALLKREQQKYITIKLHDEVSKIYGTERIDKNRPVLIVEGPLDSLFLDNCIAITGGTADPKDIPFENRIWVMDNEPRAIDTIKRIKKLVQANETVLLWDHTFKSKDINDMIKVEKYTKSELMSYITENACSGLQAQLKLSKYQKVS